MCRRKRLREWWFAFLLCVDRVSDGIRTGALWMAIQCGKERLTRFQQVFERSRLLSNYNSGKFPSRSLLSAVSFPSLKGYDTVSQPMTACIPRRWKLVSPRAATMLLMCMHHSSIPILHLHQSLDTQFPNSENDEDFCVVTEDAYDLLSISYSIDHEADHNIIHLYTQTIPMGCHHPPD